MSDTVHQYTTSQVSSAVTVFLLQLLLVLVKSQAQNTRGAQRSLEKPCYKLMTPKAYNDCRSMCQQNLQHMKRYDPTTAPGVQDKILWRLSGTAKEAAEGCM